jgi:hypothetical protein
MLNNYPSATFDKYLPLLSKVISNALIDSHPNARTLAREAYLKFEELYPKKGEEISKQLPLIAQKYIEEAKTSTIAHCKTPNPAKVREKRIGNSTKVSSNDDSKVKINILSGPNHRDILQSNEDEESKTILSAKVRTVHSKSQKKPKSIHGSDFEDLLVDAESKVWSRRAEAIDGMVDVLKNSTECTSNGQLSKAIQIIVTHMSDVHPSVIIISRWPYLR